MKEIWIVKIGSNALINQKGVLDLEIIEDLCTQIYQLRLSGIQVVLVSSGAVAASQSKKIAKFSNKGEIVYQQVQAAIGQPYLLAAYNKICKKLDILTGQLLITKSDFETDEKVYNIINCLQGMLENNVLPIVNENDVVSVRELMFTDNDELASLLALQLSANKLVILSTEKGLFDQNPKNPEAHLITTVEEIDQAEKFVADSKTDFGRGGMLPKIRNCAKVAQMGIDAFITTLKEKNVLLKISEFSASGDQENKCGTWFKPSQESIRERKKRIVCSFSRSKAKVIVDEQAEKLFSNSTKALSLLPVGVLSLENSFQKGDIVQVFGKNDKVIGIGIVEYDSETAKKYLGKQGQPVLIHYDQLFIYK